LDSDKFQLDSDKFRLDSDKFRLESDKFRLESDKFRLESDKFRLDSNKIRLESNKFGVGIKQISTDSEKFHLASIYKLPAINLKLSILRHHRKFCIALKNILPALY